ncbi:MAG TPA: biopolymer transporter ExbD [Rhizomicrobium sp.]|jgi:biopolymer transport protein ExbD
MAMNLAPSGDAPGPEMNTTPLIDVMLVLLILLIVTLPIQTHAVKLDLSHGEQTEKHRVDIVSVDFDGTVEWNGVAVSHTTLDTYLSQVAAQPDQAEIHVVADRATHYDAVAKVLADAQRLGVTRIGIVGTESYAAR